MLMSNSDQVVDERFQGLAFFANNFFEIVQGRKFGPALRNTVCRLEFFVNVITWCKLE
jgi:hypothetical protein